MKPRDEKIIRALRITWDSLDSHLDHVDEAERNFHRKCCREYAEVIKTLADIL